MLRRLLASSLLLVGVAARPALAEEYVFGQGLPIGDFLLSGYVNVVAEAPRGGDSHLMLDDLSLFVSGHVNRWINPFLESEISGVTLAQEGSGNWQHGRFVAERFYNDVQLSAEDTLRVGKMLAPVGDWNLIHAAPLVPTITRPATTFRGFSEYASGLSWLHDSPVGRVPDWEFYWQPGDEWFERPTEVTPRHYRDVWGAHLNWSSGLAYKLGLSAQSGELKETGERYTLVGANVRHRFGRVTLEGETTTSRWSGAAVRDHENEWGGYLLASYALTPAWHTIVEWERYQDHNAPLHSENTLIGLSYKPVSGIVWKLEYVDQTGTSPDIQSGWFGSFSALF